MTAADASKCGASNSSDDPVLSASDVELEPVPAGTPSSKGGDDKGNDKGDAGRSATDTAAVAKKKGRCFGGRRGAQGNAVVGDADRAAAARPRKHFDRPAPPSWVRHPFANLAFGWFTTLLWNVCFLGVIVLLSHHQCTCVYEYLIIVNDHFVITTSTTTGCTAACGVW